MNQEFLIKIRTMLEDGGVKLTDEQFQKLSQSAEEAGKKIDHASHESILSHHELRETVHATAKAFGGFGEVGLLLSVPTAAVYLLLQAVELLKKHLEDQTEAAIKAAESIQKFDETKIKAAADAAKEAANAMEDYKTAQEEAVSGLAALAEAAKAESTQYLAETDAKIEAAKKLNEEEEKLAEAKIQRMVDTGQISEEEGNRRKHIEQESLGASKANLDAQKERERIAEKERQLNEAKARLPQEQREQAASVSGAQSTNEEKKRLEVAAEEAKTQAEEARKALTKRRGEVSAEAAGQGFAGFVDTAAATDGPHVFYPEQGDRQSDAGRRFTDAMLEWTNIVVKELTLNPNEFGSDDLGKTLTERVSARPPQEPAK
jgi:hypothetical protein